VSLTPDETKAMEKLQTRVQERVRVIGGLLREYSDGFVADMTVTVLVECHGFEALETLSEAYIDLCVRETEANLVDTLSRWRRGEAVLASDE